MKFATFLHMGRERVGLVDDAARQIHIVNAASMLDLIVHYDQVPSAILKTSEPIDFASIRFLAPIPRPHRNIFCVGKNYRAHAQEFARSGFEAGATKGAKIDEYPAIFTKPGACVIGPGDTIDSHSSVTSAVDYEGELAIVIGKGGRGINRRDADKHIWGYTIVNDVTARDKQKNHRQWFLGKALDTFCPMGPWITIAPTIDHASLQLTTRVNGELRQDASTKDLIFDVPTLVETISQGITLQPGDVIATGTPSGVGIGYSPPKFLKSGDAIAISISGIGVLENTVA